MLPRLERPLLLSGLALITLHLLDLAVSGPATSPLGVLAIVGLPALWVAVQPRLIRTTRVVLAVTTGLIATGFGVVSHGLHAVLLGPDRYDVTGLLFLLGGLALLGSAVAAAAAPRGPRRRHRALRTVGSAVGVLATLALVVIPVSQGVMITHAPRWPIAESALRIPHEEVRIHGLSAWYVPSRNGAAALLIHGSGGSRARVVAHVRMLARHGYGVLALDLPGDGESHGHANGLGDTAQPAVEDAVDYLARRPGITRIAGFGTSLGAEVLLDAAAHDPRIRAVVADGATRPEDGDRALRPSGFERAVGGLSIHAARAIGGTRPAPSLIPLMPRIAPRPVLLVATTGFPAEIPANRLYARAGGQSTRLWELRGVGHTRGLKRRPAEYERRTIGFLDRALSSRGADGPPRTARATAS